MTTLNITMPRSVFAPRPGFLAAASFAGLTRWIAQAVAVAGQRRHLAALDAHALQDAGISPQAAAAEAARPFWSW